RAAQRGAEGQDLPQLATPVRIAFPELGAVRRGLFLDSQLGANAADGESVSLFQAMPKVVGFGEKKAGIQGEDVNGQLVPADQVQQHAAFHTEPSPKGDAGAKSLRSPA